MPPPPGVRGFVPTVKFEGTKAGLRYRMGPSGLGYYPEGSGPNDASSSFWDLGFRVLPSVFTPDVVDGMQRQIVDYIRGNGSRVSTNLLDRKGGWYFADFASEPRLANIFDQLHKSPKLRAALTELLGGSPDSFRVLTRNEIYCDWGFVWHQDVPALAPYFAYYKGLPRNVYSRLPGTNETYQIITCALYLQDHSRGAVGRGLSVRNRSHLPKPSPGRATPQQATALRSEKGDMVLFDSRLFHTGQSTKYANWNRDASRRYADFRTVVTISFGRRNAWSDAWARAFHARNLIINEYKCSPRSRSCVSDVVSRDLKRTPLRAG